MKNELYKAIKAYCDENHCWKAFNTVSDWNAILNTSYSAATFTALVSDGRLERDKRYGEKSYSYRLVPTPEELQKQAEAKRQDEIERAKRIVERYDERVADIKERYEELIAEAERYLKERMAFVEEDTAKAKELLKQEAV